MYIHHARIARQTPLAPRHQPVRHHRRRDEEDDESYRYRIQLALSSQTGCSEADLRAALLKVPGIQDVVFERLSGTYNVYVYGISPDIPPSRVCRHADDGASALHLHTPTTRHR